jgi:hypothetical protein
MKEIVINILSKMYQRRYEVLKGETPSDKNLTGDLSPPNKNSYEQRKENTTRD